MDCRAYLFAQTVHTLHAHHRRRPIQPGTGYRTYQYDISKFDVSKVPKMEAMRAGGSAWASMQKMFIRLPAIASQQWIHFLMFYAGRRCGAGHKSTGWVGGPANSFAASYVGRPTVQQPAALAQRQAPIRRRHPLRFAHLCRHRREGRRAMANHQCGFAKHRQVKLGAEQAICTSPCVHKGVLSAWNHSTDQSTS